MWFLRTSSGMTLSLNYISYTREPIYWWKMYLQGGIFYLFILIGYIGIYCSLFSLVICTISLIFANFIENMTNKITTMLWQSWPEVIYQLNFHLLWHLKGNIVVASCALLISYWLDLHVNMKFYAVCYYADISGIRNRFVLNNYKSFFLIYLNWWPRWKVALSSKSIAGAILLKFSTRSRSWFHWTYMSHHLDLGTAYCGRH